MKKQKQSWNWLNGLSNRNKPAGIKTLNIQTMPPWADSYVYKITSEKLNKTYIGYHKENGETYFGSTTDQELILLISDSNADLTLEIKKEWYGSMKEMIQLEHELLVEADARNNPNYWNKTNGQSGVPKFNREAIHKIRDIVKNEIKDYVSEPVLVSELSEIPKAQVREVTYDNDNLKDIMDSIKRQGGSTELAKPIPTIPLQNFIGNPEETDSRLIVKALSKRPSGSKGRKPKRGFQGESMLKQFGRKVVWIVVLALMLYAIQHFGLLKFVGL